MDYLPAYRLKLYRNFKAIDAADYHGIARYYERFEEAMATLDAEEYFDCTLAYTHALFETGNYAQHVVMCDHLLEIVIMQNIERWGGEDIYARLLFRKAAALFHLQEYPKSEHILRELLKLSPLDQPALYMLRKCLIRQNTTVLMRTRAAAVALTFLAAAAVAVELLIVRPFFLDYYEKALLVHNVLLGAGLLVLAGGESWQFWRCHRQAIAFAKKMQARRLGAISRH
jgi:tetratricopeptide (TPR) repeat protein